MSNKIFNRKLLHIKPVSERKNKVFIEKDYIHPTTPHRNFSENELKILKETISKIKDAKTNNKPIVLAFGAHSIKNGLGPIIIQLMNNGWLTHLATNGAGVIHDWEFSYIGESSEDVRRNVKLGEFGTWLETGFYINLAIILGAFEEMGYGESVGKMIELESLSIPTVEYLQEYIRDTMNKPTQKTAAAVDLITTINQFNLAHGEISIPHKFKNFSVQAAAYKLGIPFTAHPMFGHDIIYTHPINNGAAIGRTAEKDFLTFAETISNIENGVYLSIGSAVMSPMIFEKSMSMAQNVALQKGENITNHYILVADLAENSWDWNTSGEPPMDNPAYYLRYCKTFNRMGGSMNYLTIDNRDLLLYLVQNLT